ncbi:MAG: ABC transporter ATP-binding protein [Oligoflexia bacterium]|nr:ABC transporter ATP-binding protein [Oligoflexia bacterium]
MIHFFIPENLTTDYQHIYNKNNKKLHQWIWNMLKIDSVSKKFKTDFWSRSFWALRGVSFEIAAGDVVGFLGANGAGKTTLIKIIMGLIKATHGKIYFSKIMGVSKKSIFSNLGFLPERPYFYPNLTGRDFIAYLGKLNNLSSLEINQQGQKWAQRLGIDFALDRQMKNYSKGMLQRVGIISTLLHRPKLIILDEPLSGLDPIGRKEIKDIVADVRKQYGTTIFFSSHIVPDVEELCQKVIFLEKGKMLYSGSVSELVSKHSSSKYRVILEWRGCWEDKAIICNYPNSFLLYENELEKVLCFEIAKEEKEQFLSFIMDKGAKIVSFSQKSIKLEEILYNVNGDR